MAPEQKHVRLRLEHHVVLPPMALLDSKRSPFFLREEMLVLGKAMKHVKSKEHMAILIVVVSVLVAVLGLVWELQWHPNWSPMSSYLVIEVNIF